MEWKDICLFCRKSITIKYIDNIVAVHKYPTLPVSHKNVLENDGINVTIKNTTRRMLLHIKLRNTSLLRAHTKEHKTVEFKKLNTILPVTPKKI